MELTKFTGPIKSGGNPWSSYMGEIYKGRRGPQPLGTVVFEEIEAKAREKLKDCGGAFMFAGGSAGTNSTYRANLRAFDKYQIIPRTLVNASQRSLETTIFGVVHPSPILMAPIGVQCIFHPDAEFNPARAGKALNVPFILSSVSSRTIEEVAEANGDGHRWFQLYWPRSNEITVSLLKRAKENGYKALVVTVDNMTIGWRTHDLETSYSPFHHGVGMQMCFSDPVFMARCGKQPVTDYHPEFPYDSAKFDQKIAAGDPKIQEEMFVIAKWNEEMPSCQSWEDLKFLRDNWEGPLVLKGISSTGDAEKALTYGVDGIVVSNHGGRQVDGAISTLLALEMIMKSPIIKAAQSSGKLTILFDSGIRTGSDIIKALALGAQAVLLGRPWLYASAVAGQAGVEQVLKHTLANLDNTLGLIGFTKLSDVQGKGEEILVKVA